MGLGIELGIDIGSTYTTLAKYDKAEDAVTELTATQGSPCSVPSAVAVPKRGSGGNRFGEVARGLLGNGNYNVFERFKMLILEEDNAEILRRNGYDTESNSPRKIMASYLTYLLSVIMNRHAKGESINKIVACVPEEWDKSFRHLDGRSVLRSILTNDVLYGGDKHISQENVRIVTEPEAASAYFAYQYMKNAKKPFCGYLLLIDFGGGTLDITLSKISSDGDGRMNIEACEHGGRGENHRTDSGTFQIGCAGIAYMERVLLCAAEECHIDADPADDSFAEALKQLEDQIKSPIDDFGCNKLELTFGDFGGYSNFGKILTDKRYDDLTTNLFCEITCGDTLLPVTYRQLYRAYHEVIEPVLNDELKRITDKIPKYLGEGRNPRDPSAGLREDFKIATVGGFSNFCLVSEQIHEFYNIDPEATSDGRLKNIDSAKTETAIACGAALIAADKVTLDKLAPLSMGLHLSTGDGGVDLFAIRYHQKIECKKPYYLLRDNDEKDTHDNRVKLTGVTGISHFVIRDDERLDAGGSQARLKDEFAKKFAGLSGNCLYYLGMSMDEDGIYSIHVVPTDKPKDETIVPMASFQEMMELQDVN